MTGGTWKAGGGGRDGNLGAVVLIALVCAAALGAWVAIGWVLSSPIALAALAVVLVAEVAAAGSALLDWREARLLQASWRHAWFMGHATVVLRLARRAGWWVAGVRFAREQRRRAKARAVVVGGGPVIVVETTEPPGTRLARTDRAA